MKKTFLIIFTLFSMYSYSKIKEKVITSDGQVIVLMEDKTWEYEERLNDIKDFESKMKLSNLEVSAKRSNGRSLTGTITNLNRKKLEYVTYKIKWLIDGEYSTLREFTIKDLDYNESRDFNYRIKLEGISGRDYKFEVSDYKWED